MKWEELIQRWRRLKAACHLAAFAALIVPGATMAAAPATPGFRADRILVMPRVDAPPANLAAFHAASGARVLRQFAGIQNLEVVQVPAGAQARDFVDRYQRSGLVAFAELDYALSPAIVPNDPYYANGSLWHLHNYGQSGGTSDADVDAPEAWDVLRTASNVVVAVVDTGIRYSHEDLAANLWVNPGEIAGNGLDDDGDGYIDNVHGINAAANNGNPIDVLGHGTQVAGFIGGVGHNGLGVAGVAWRVKLMACRFYDDAGNGYVADAVQAIDFARTKGAQVMNASFVSTTYSSSLYSAINSCRTVGIVFVAAAGNDTVNNDTTPYYPASFNLDNIVAVAATTRNDGLASFSNYGATTVDLAAPGLDLVTTYHSADNAYVMNSGTSFSSPIVAGAFALMRARFPTATYRQLIDQLLAATDPLPALNGNCVTGGRLNLARALGPGVIADFTSSPLAGTLPLSVQFTNTSFGAITGLVWNFGDGTTSSEPNPTHVYSTQGVFTASLIVTGASGTTSTTNHQVIAVDNYIMTNATFAWIDPGAMPSLGLSGDAVSGAQALPFPFQFYGQSCATFHVGANGLVGFENQGLSTAANSDLPSASAPNNVLCPFWDDLNPSSSAVRFGVVGMAPNRKAVISWVNVPGAGGGPPASFTFQVVLEETSHNIVFQYLEVQPGSPSSRAAGRSATIGIEHGSGQVARRFSYNGSTLLANNQAILFTSGTAGGPAVVNVAPAVTVTSPAQGALFTAPASFTLAATASDSDGTVSQVEFFNGGTSLGTDTTSPYDLALNSLAAGSYTLSVVATDNTGARATNAVIISVSNSPPAAVTLLNPRLVSGEFVFSFLSRSGAVYSVQYALSFPVTNWLVLTNLPGHGSVIAVTNRSAEGEQRFYRVESR